MRKKTRLFVLSLTLAALLCALPVSAAGNGWLAPRANEYPGFADVTDTWCEDYVRTAYEAGLMEGNSHTAFDAGSTLNRGQAAAILTRIIDPSLRVRFTPKPFDLCRDVLLVDPEATALTVDGTAITMEQAAQELCLSLRQEDCDAISGEIPKDDLTESLQIALKELVTDVALDHMAAQQNLTWTQQELEAQYGPLPVGAQGIQEEGWLWEYSHNWLSQQLLLRYLVQYGSAIDPASGDMAAEVRFQQDLDAVKASLSVTPSPALQNLDAAGAQSRLLQYFPCD